MIFGLETAQRCAGTLYEFAEPFRDRRVEIAFRLGVRGLRRFVRDRRIATDGTIFIEGFAEGEGRGVGFEGSIVMKLFDEKRLPYDLAFHGDDGRAYRLRGQRNFFVHDPVLSLATLPASLFADEGGERDREVGRARLRFARTDREIPALVRALRAEVRLPRLQDLDDARD